MLFIFFNALLRTTYPTSYVPAVQTHEAIVFHPMMIRTLATIAEYEFYEKQATIFNFEEWFVIYAVGECISWLHLLFQSEVLGMLEDIVWVVFQICILFTMEVNVHFWLILVYVSVVVYGHLPQLYKRIQPPYWQTYTVTRFEPQLDMYSSTWIKASVGLKLLVYLYMDTL